MVLIDKKKVACTGIVINDVGEKVEITEWATLNWCKNEGNREWINLSVKADMVKVRTDKDQLCLN